jgi:hypothetical protein
MGEARLGSASIFIEFSDEKGLYIEHGTDKVTLLQVAPERLNPSDWDDIWAVLRGFANR